MANRMEATRRPKKVFKWLQIFKSIAKMIGPTSRLDDSDGLDDYRGLRSRQKKFELIFLGKLAFESR